MERLELFYLNPQEVVVQAGRIREDFGDISDLAKSLQKYKQIQPVIITRDNVLVAGERRLRACREAGIDVLCAYSGEISERALKELEIQENLSRKDFTPYERAKAVEQLHNMKVEEYGTPNNRGDGWSIEKTAELLNMVKGSVHSMLECAKVADFLGEAGKKAKTMSELRAATKGLKKVVERDQAQSKWDKELEEIQKSIPTPSKTGGGDPVTSNLYDFSQYVYQKDVHQELANVAPGSFDIILTDPPYGIDISKVRIAASSRTGGPSQTGFKFDDSYMGAIEDYYLLGKESYRITSAKAHCFVFFPPEMYEIVKRSFVNAGWKTNHRPIIWVKGTSGQNNQPAYWPSSCYEMIFYFRKDNSKIILEGKPDWIQYPSVHYSKKKHPTEKPVDLLKDLLGRVALPGMRLFDPFMGSGSSLAAGWEMQLKVTGWDIEPECLVMAKETLKNVWLKEKS